MASYSECNSFSEIKDKNICYAKIDLYNHLNNNPSLEKFLRDGAYLPPTGITDLDTVIENESSTTFQCTSTALNTAISEVTAVVNKSSLFNATTGVVVSDPYAVSLALQPTQSEAAHGIARKDALIANIYSQEHAIQKRRPNTDFVGFTAPGVSTITSTITAALTQALVTAASPSAATTDALSAARRAAAIMATANEVCLPTVESTISVPKRMHIPTNNITRLNLPRSNYTTQGKIISFEIVKEYSDVESDKIYRAIQRSVCSSNNCRAGKGSDIVFDKHGNIMLKWMAPSGEFETEIIKNNNLSEDLKNEIDSKDFSSALDNETDAKEYIDETT
jgi:hypothetical protein